MASAVIKFSAILFFVGACVADVWPPLLNPIARARRTHGYILYGKSYAELPQANALAQPVTEVCLGCICQAVSGCQQNLRCEGDSCGLFHITWGYWADAGKPTINGQSPEDKDAYPNCAIDPYCAAQTVQGYMRKFGQDCNGDGQINCYDYMAIHKKGGYGCVGDLPFNYVNVFNQCIAAVAAAQG